jgi:hypothetical protein
MGKSAVSLNVGLGEFPEAFGISFAVWLHHEVHPGDNLTRVPGQL